MHTNSYAHAKKNDYPTFSFLNRLCMKVHADENDPDTDHVTPSTEPSGGSPAPSLNLEEVISRVRREEKDKLYGKIKKLEEERNELRGKVNDYIMQIAQYQARLEDAEKKADPAEVKKLQDQVEQLTKDLEEAKKSAPDEEELRKKIQAEFDVKLYAKEQLAEHEDILSIFHDEVKGNTKEEVDASIAAAVEKSTKVKKDLGLVDDEGNPTDGKKKKKKKDEGGGTQRKDPPVANPTSDNEEPGFDPDYIRNLDPRSDEYKEFRKKMGLR